MQTHLHNSEQSSEAQKNTCLGHRWVSSETPTPLPNPIQQSPDKEALVEAVYLKYFQHWHGKGGRTARAALHELWDLAERVTKEQFSL